MSGQAFSGLRDCCITRKRFNCITYLKKKKVYVFVALTSTSFIFCPIMVKKHLPKKITENVLLMHIFRKLCKLCLLHNYSVGFQEVCGTGWSFSLRSAFKRLVIERKDSSLTTQCTAAVLTVLSWPSPGRVMRVACKVPLWHTETFFQWKLMANLHTTTYSEISYF